MRRRRAGQLTVVAVVVTAVGCTAAPVGPPAGPAEPTGPAGQRAVSVVPVDSTPLRLLRQWDAARAAAYAEGSVRALRDLYTPGSSAGAADVRLLREYVARGYRVVGMEMQILRLRVLDQGPGEWRLRVTDRLHHAVAVSAQERLRLPRDRASTRELRLVPGEDGRWRVADVRAAEPDASDGEPR